MMVPIPRVTADQASFNVNWWAAYYLGDFTLDADIYTRKELNYSSH